MTGPLSQTIDAWLYEPCRDCGTAKRGHADYRKRTIRLSVPPECRDPARCEGDIRAALAPPPKAPLSALAGERLPGGYPEVRR